MLTMPVDMTRTGMRIEELITERGFTNKEVASLLGVTPECVFKWRHGKSIPNIDNLIDLAELLRVSMDELIVKQD